MVYSYAIPDNNYEIITAGKHRDLLNFLTLKEKYPDVKLLISIVREDEDQASYWNDLLQGEAEDQERFCTNIINYARRYKFDGIDLVIKPYDESSEYYKLLSLFFGKLRNHIEEEAKVQNVQPLLLSLFAPHDFLPRMDESIDKVDWIVVNGLPKVRNYQKWTFPGRPDLLNVIENYKIYQEESKYAKITLAVSFLGIQVDLDDDEIISARHLPLSESCKIVRELGLEITERNEDLGQIVKDNNFLMAYDDPDSVKRYINSIDKKLVGGVAIIDLDLEDLNGSCELGEFPLTSAAIEGLMTDIMD